MKNIVNIINFVRGVEPRPGRENLDLVKPVKEQIALLRKFHLRGTFLLEYDALINDTYIELMKSCADICEVGLWLEIVQPLVEKIGETWYGRYPWDWYNDVGFLIGYEPDVRIRLVDEAMERFREIYGYYPESVGSWHLDAVSLAHLEAKYHIKACCICRDQVGMDGYTLQGGYYHQAYYPSKNNIFCPANTPENQISVPVFRMLGSDPIHAYDYEIKKYGMRIVPSLEPVQYGKMPDWCDWYFRENFDGTGLAFQYTQVGQENSFGWHKMGEGLTYQMSQVQKLVDEGAVEVMTLGESGKWYKSVFEQTPAAAYTAFHEYLDADRKSVWYCSRFYRTGLLWDDGVVYFRDMYIFDDEYKEKYLEKRCQTRACEFRNLPVLDGVLFTGANDEQTAGVYFTANGQNIIWTDFSYHEESMVDVPENEGEGAGKSAAGDMKTGNAQIGLANDKYKAVITLKENHIEIQCSDAAIQLHAVYNEDRACGRNTSANKMFENSNADGSIITCPTYIRKQDDKVLYSFDGREYGIQIKKEQIGGSWKYTVWPLKYNRK